jgi:hypothetical protein
VSRLCRDDVGRFRNSRLQKRNTRVPTRRHTERRTAQFCLVLYQSVLERQRVSIEPTIPSGGVKTGPPRHTLTKFSSEPICCLAVSASWSGVRLNPWSRPFSVVLTNTNKRDTRDTDSCSPARSLSVPHIVTRRHWQTLRDPQCGRGFFDRFAEIVSCGNALRMCDANSWRCFNNGRLAQRASRAPPGPYIFVCKPSRAVTAM